MHSDFSLKIIEKSGSSLDLEPFSVQLARLYDMEYGFSSQEAYSAVSRQHKRCSESRRKPISGRQERNFDVQNTQH